MKVLGLERCIQHQHGKLFAEALQGLGGSQVCRDIATLVHLALQHDRRPCNWRSEQQEPVKFAVSLVQRLYPTFVLPVDLPEVEADNLLANAVWFTGVCRSWEKAAELDIPKVPYLCGTASSRQAMFHLTCIACYASMSTAQCACHYLVYQTLSVLNTLSAVRLSSCNFCGVNPCVVLLWCRWDQGVLLPASASPASWQMATMWQHWLSCVCCHGA